METIDDIPIGKIKRAAKLMGTGAKVGFNYLKSNIDKLYLDKQKVQDKLDEANAKDIYNSLKKLKGSALKTAQMLSLEQSILPKAYTDQFSLAQFSVPPLSEALVVKTFKRYFGKTPSDLFDTFEPVAIRAASIGQVHKAYLNNKAFAVKIQYPGVAESISSDLALIKPVAMKLLNIKGEGSEAYFKEVETKLLEETNYNLELEEAERFITECSELEGLSFPNYYKKLSNQRIITMDWMEGNHISEFAQSNQDEDLANALGQRLWDFYMFQLHVLKKVHADPHPGNFLVSSESKLIVLDFGCTKSIPLSFYTPYFQLAKKENLTSKELFEEKLFELEIVKHDDSPEEQALFKDMFYELLSLITKPFHQETFDFSSKDFFNTISQKGQKFAQITQQKKLNGNRGSKHFIYREYQNLF